MEKQEDEATGGDGVSHHEAHEKKLMEKKLFACKRAYGCKTW